MRTVTAAELLTLASLNRTVHKRVKVANASGTMIDVSTWVEHIAWDQDVDQPVSGATVSFARADGPTKSFSPLRTDSTLNRLDDGVTYGPQLDVNHAITIETVTTQMGASVVSGDWKLEFQGTIDIVDFEATPVTVHCRDKGAQLVDRWVETPKAYGSTIGVAVETVMQSILDDVFGAGVIPLFNNTSPPVSYVISPAYQQQVQSVMDAQVALAQNPGDDVRYRWDDGTSTFRFTLSTPPRTKTTPDYTFGPKDYFAVTQLALDSTNIRNAIIVNYPDSNNQYNRATVLVTDGPSITKYGRKVFIITEADTSPVNTTTEATALANAALADLKDPKADMEIELPYFWPGDIGDLYRFTANGVHFNTNQDLAVVSIAHDLSKGKHRTRIKVRGTPVGQYATWLARGGTIGGAPSTTRPPTPFIIPLGTEINDATWDLQFYATFGSGGGGTNLTYTITLKKTFGAATTLSSGNASAFPLNLTVTRDVRYDAVLTFTATDAATGLVRMETYAIPSVTSNFLGSTGTTFVAGVRGSPDFATNNSGGTTSFGVNRHNDEQAGLNATSKTFGVSYDSVPQVRALPQSWLLPGASSTVDRVIEMKAVNLTVAGYDIRAVSSTGSTSSAKSENWATTLNGTPASSQTLANINASAFADLSQANTTSTTYTANYDVDTTAMLGTNTLFVSLYKNNGTASTSWTLVGSKSYGSGVNTTGQSISFTAAMALDWDCQIQITYQNAPAVGQKASVVVRTLTYNQITAGTETAITTAAGNAILFQAMEAP